MKSRWRIVAVVSALAIILGVGVGFGVTALRKPQTKPDEIKVKREKKPEAKPKAGAVCPADGRKPSVGVSRPLAIMVENLTTIRPQAGTGDACIVVEGLAEGGITRFMLVFGDHEAENIGPVRSARTHFVALARGWDAVFGHVGGSKYALAEIRNWGVFDWDQIGHAADYSRVGWARAPHDVFTSSERIRSAAAQQDDSSDKKVKRFFKFKKAPAVDKRPEGFKKVVIDFSDPGYLVEYQYDRRRNRYKRFNGGTPHIDARSKEQLAPVNIVILRAQTFGIPGGSGVLDVKMSGSGPATIIRDGTVVEGTWEKPGPDSPLRLIDSSGADIRLTVGQTWIEIVKPDTPVEIVQ